MSQSFDQTAFGKLLLCLRNNKKLTQEELAQKLNTTKSTISKLERGNLTPNIDTFFKIADFFNLSLNDLGNSAETLKQLQPHENISETLSPEMPTEILNEIPTTANSPKGWSPRFLCFGLFVTVAIILGIIHISTKNADSSPLPCTLISQEYTVHEMYGYSLQLQYTTSTKYEKEQLEEYAIELSKEWTENKEIEHISLLFYFNDEAEPYFVYGELINP